MVKKKYWLGRYHQQILPAVPPKASPPADTGQTNGTIPPALSTHPPKSPVDTDYSKTSTTAGQTNETHRTAPPPVPIDTGQTRTNPTLPTVPPKASKPIDTDQTNGTSATVKTGQTRTNSALSAIPHKSPADTGHTNETNGTAPPSVPIDTG